jgi:hypothetical protein
MKQLAFLSFWVFDFILDGGGKQYDTNLDHVKRKVSKFQNHDLIIWLEDRNVFLPVDTMRKVITVISSHIDN